MFAATKMVLCQLKIDNQHTKQHIWVFFLHAQGNYFSCLCVYNIQCKWAANLELGKTLAYTFHASFFVLIYNLNHAKIVEQANKLYLYIKVRIKSCLFVYTQIIW